MSEKMAVEVFNIVSGESDFAGGSKAVKEAKNKQWERSFHFGIVFLFYAALTLGAYCVQCEAAN